MLASDYRRTASVRCSMRFTPPRPVAWGSACSSVARSLRDIKGASGRIRTRRPLVRLLPFPSPSTPGKHPTQRQANTKVQWTEAVALMHSARASLRMMNRPLLVAVVDDSESVRESLQDLLQQSGFAVQTFSSAEEFLAVGAERTADCLVLDVGLPGMS